MRLGLIARCEIARGIAIQSKNFYDHLPVDRVLLVRMPRPDCPERPDWYANRTDAMYDPRRHELDEHLVRGWLSKVDVVFTVETPNDWRLPLWCKEMGVKLVIQGNPEFVRHGQKGFEWMPHPDEWWWPSNWRAHHIPRGRYMPVPMDPRPSAPGDDDRLSVVHPVGKTAFADRNGTALLVQAAGMMREPIRLTINSIETGLPDFPRSKNIEYNLVTSTVTDQWSIYDFQDVVVIPRRYGGLCLPALEGAACGKIVAMSATSPNGEFAAVSIGGQSRRMVNLACGKVPIFDASPARIAEAVDALARDRHLFDTYRSEQQRLLPTWDEWQPKYLKALEAL